MKSFFRLAIITSLFVTAPCLWSQESPRTESSGESNIWNDSLKADVSRGQVSRSGKLLFRIQREGNAAYLSLPRKINLFEINIWNIEVNYEGQAFYAAWNKKKKAWRFNLMGKGLHTIRVSKRKNNTENEPHSWFVLGI